MNNQWSKKRKREGMKYILYLSWILRWAPTCEDRAVEGQSGNRGRNDCASTSPQSVRLMRIIVSPFGCVRFANVSRVSRVFLGRLLRAKRATKIIIYARLVRAECAPTASNPFYLSLLFTQSGCALWAGEKHPRGARRVRVVRKRQGLGEQKKKQFEFHEGPVEENPSPSLGMHDPVLWKRWSRWGGRCLKFAGSLLSLF